MALCCTLYLAVYPQLAGYDRSPLAWLSPDALQSGVLDLRVQDLNHQPLSLQGPVSLDFSDPAPPVPVGVNISDFWDNITGMVYHELDMPRANMTLVMEITAPSVEFEVRIVMSWHQNAIHITCLWGEPGVVFPSQTLQWRHHEHDSVSNHQPRDCIVYSSIYWGTYERKHQSSASLAFVRGIHRWPVNSSHKGPVTWKMSPFDDVIMKGPYITVAEQGLCQWVKLLHWERFPQWLRPHLAIDREWTHILNLLLLPLISQATAWLLWVFCIWLVEIWNY